MKEKAKGPFVFFQPLAFLILVGLLFGNEADSSCLYFPQVSSGLVGSNAELGVVNTSGRTVTGSFVFYDPSGYLVSKSLKATINPRGSFRFVVDEHCENPEQVGYVVFDTTSENCSGYALISRDNSRACVLAAEATKTKECIYRESWMAKAGSGRFCGCLTPLKIGSGRLWYWTTANMSASN